MSKKLLSVLFACLVLLPAVAISADLGRARMSLVQGDVQIHSEEAGDWVPAAMNMPLQEGDQLWVPEDGRSELQLLGGALIRLDSLTAFDIIALESNSSQFYLPEGRAYLNNSRSDIDHIQIDTPISSVSCYDNGLVMVDVTERGATDISVLRGYAYAETRNGKIRVSAGSTLSIGEDLSAELFPLNATDDWAEWNQDLDRRLAESGSSYRYLPRELADYRYDLDTYGRWLYDSSYGYVWTPTLFISVNWAPYHIGRWVWIGGNYVWVSHEPWGWAPYHYGRWIFRGGIGWCWVPPRRGSVYWGPGYVGWVYTPTYVAWVPLAPADIYYGHGYYGPGSVNINTMAAGRLAFNRGYVNINARNAVTSMHRDTFLHGGKSVIPLPENPFKQRNVGIGPPRFTPKKASYAPALKTIPTAKLPPQRIRAISPETLRKERQRVPDRSRSVFSPGMPARTMPVITREAPVQPARQQLPGTVTEEQRRSGKERVVPISPIIQTPRKTGETRGTEAPKAPAPAQVRQPATQLYNKPSATVPPVIRKQRIPTAPATPPAAVLPTQQPAARKPGVSMQPGIKQPATIPTAPQQPLPVGTQRRDQRSIVPSIPPNTAPQTVAPQPIAPQPVAPQPVAPLPVAPRRITPQPTAPAPALRSPSTPTPYGIGSPERQNPTRFGAPPVPTKPTIPPQGLPSTPAQQLQQFKPSTLQPAPVPRPVEQPSSGQQETPRRSKTPEPQMQKAPDAERSSPITHGERRSGER